MARDDRFYWGTGDVKITQATRWFAGVPARTMRPTQDHRLALKQGIFGTVSAINPAGREEYFDYNLDAAYDWAGIKQHPFDPRQDPRVWSEHHSTQRGRKALWILR
jgi:hypothetical protein